MAGIVAADSPRERSSLNAGWRFTRFTTAPDQLSYDVLKKWILPSSNKFTSNSTKYERPSGATPGGNVSYVQGTFDDSEWEAVNLPHDWAIKGPFGAPGISGDEGKLPYNGVGWYRKTISVNAHDIKAGKNLFLDIDGAMSYSAVWLNGVLVGGWPYGYSSFRLDLTPYAKSGDNILAIRLENQVASSRWYPGAGIYRNVWLVKTNPIHVAQYGTKITTPSITEAEATVDLSVTIENKSNSSQNIDLVTKIYELDSLSRKAVGEAKAAFERASVKVAGGTTQVLNDTTVIPNPKLWGPVPEQTPNEYVAVSTLYVGGTNKTIDVYETHFGVRSIVYDPNRGLLINGVSVYVKGVCNHHDLGSLGAAFNERAAERQLQMLQEAGTNALRTSHNPPAPELLELTDRLGVIVQAEAFDAWNIEKTDNDYHLLFPEWHEADMRSFVQRDRNHPSIISWSIGNEIPEQTTTAVAEIARELQGYAHEEDPTRQVTSGLNNAKPASQISQILDIIGLNYQGEGQGGTNWVSTFPTFHSTYPEKMIWSTESASTVSTRGTYIFPVTPANSTTVVIGSDGVAGVGVNDTLRYVSAYELYAPSWASSPDKVFEMQDRHPYAAGEFVWTGWDYIGEPTPYGEDSRSSYFGFIDLAGFKKDRFYLYQARWRSDLPMAHILPHWTWPDRVGKVTPVHVFTSGDEAELFVNGKSAGRQKKVEFQSRFRWDNVTYQAGDIKVVAYKDGEVWAEDSRKTVGSAAKLNVTADRTSIQNDGYDLSFISVAVVDENGDTVPEASNSISFSISGPGEIASTDNGDPTDMTAFPSLDRKAFSGYALAIVRSKPGASGKITVSAASSGLEGGEVDVEAS
ncbi:glycoside hydrolase [Massarina eburnea CBS 473.64]|uniref:Glycoside hydrolase n=1 Tax=Massarina eburnea CBS 473.64 TaxID=1395130 RepID=A0A6A6RQY4_9PLEO|nr:glycoside hydrolase [Massarina eburnea CBS 473.64]